MELHRVIANIHHDIVHTFTATATEIEPGRLFVRDSAGTYRDVYAEELHSGEAYVISRWLPDLASARVEVAAELERRAEQLHKLASDCSGEVASNG